MANKPVSHLQDTGHSWLAPQSAPEPPYQVQEFPKRMHHKTKDSVVVNNKEEQAALGPEWAQTPAAFAEELAKEKADADKAKAKK